MLKELQPSLTVEDQLENLKILGLEIPSDTAARTLLQDISYFRLIKAYSLGLKPKNGSYYSGVSIDQLTDLYLFNSNFRQVLLPQIEKVEVNLRCRLSNYFPYKYGVLGYEDPANFQDTVLHRSFYVDLQEKIQRNQQNPFIRNYRTNYLDGKVPFYALVELFSFGTLSKFFKNMKGTDKKAIASTYGIGYTYFESWIESIAYVRNVCAHYGRLYNAIIPKKPMMYTQYVSAGISNDRIFAVLICMKHLLPSDNYWAEFVDSIQVLFDKYPCVKIDSMGFNTDWKSLLS